MIKSGIAAFDISRDDAKKTIAQEKYKLGTLSLIDLEQAQVDALTAHLAENSLTYQLLKAAQQWNLLTSQPLLGKY